MRPTSDRVRESLFARLGPLDGRRVLDLYAGSGALGIEALSRGAREAVFVERAGAVAAGLRANVEALGLGAEARVVRGDVPAVIRRLGAAEERFDLVLLDPPYADVAARDEALRALVTSGILAARAMVVLEATKRAPRPVVEGLALLDERRHGDTVIHRLVPEPREEGEAADGGER